jgi:Uncharacterized conserved protein
MNSRDKRIIDKLISEIEMIEMLISGLTESAFLTEERTKRAVCMTLINIGELVKNLSDDLKQGKPRIPWRSIAGLRDVTAHRYQTLRMGDVWFTVQQDIPQLKVELLKIMTDETG